jgi:hypothetical protein
LKVLTFSTILLHSYLFWTHFVKVLIFSKFRSFMTSSSYQLFCPHEVPEFMN